MSDADQNEVVDAEKAIEHVREALRCLGFYSQDNIDHLGHYKETPERFVRYLQEFTQPFDPEKTLKVFEAETRALVMSSRIPYRQACAHHLIPAFGYAVVAYLPKGKIVGLSKLARIVTQVCTSRPSVQETITDTIADILDDYLEPRGVMVVIQAEHGCVACRGVAAPGIATITSTVRGYFRDVSGIRQEVLALMSVKGVRE